RRCNRACADLADQCRHDLYVSLALLRFKKIFVGAVLKSCGLELTGVLRAISATMWLELILVMASSITAIHVLGAED
ncbi:MAG: hypothetical protein ACJ8EK_16560, partial [Bradyrhizobium sp.]